MSGLTIRLKFNNSETLLHHPLTPPNSPPNKEVKKEDSVVKSILKKTMAGNIDKKRVAFSENKLIRVTHLDGIEGIAHFEVDRRLECKLKLMLAGYDVDPRFLDNRKEIPSDSHKKI